MLVEQTITLLRQPYLYTLFLAKVLLEDAIISLPLAI
jgi:hypothetical protein